MPLFIALAYTTEVEWQGPDYADAIKDYTDFNEAHAAVIKGGHALYPTATATTVRVPEGKGGEAIISDGPYAETKEALTGFWLLECADREEAVKLAEQIPSAWHGVVEVRAVWENVSV